jgi:SAM-dependent methyltransferase
MSDLSNAHGEAQRFFDRIADDYRRRSQAAVYNLSSLSFRRRQDMVVRWLSETPAGGMVLDYGMGPAVFGRASIARGLRYVGIDISERMVNMARELDLGGAEFVVGDLEALDRFVNSADTVLLIGLIDYLQDPLSGLRRLARCVKPGGRLIMSFRNHRSVPRLVRTLGKRAWRALRLTGGAARTAFAAPVLENSFVPGVDLVPLLREEGFEDPVLEYLDCSPVQFNVRLPRPVWEGWRKADETLGRVAPPALCASGVLVARRR